MSKDNITVERCPWCGDDPFYVRYHDEEWGVPLRGNDDAWFERLSLEAAQAGLSWITILRKRENYREALDGFDPHKVILYDEAKVAVLMNNAGIVRNRLKINAVIHNAQRFIDVQNEFGSFSDYIWAYVDGTPIQNTLASLSDAPAATPLSQQISKDLKKRGFKFVGPTIVYAFMQATGMVNDHLVTCFRHAELGGTGSHS
jgi:DNA-3-methyladenine glycosylase I